MLRHWRFTKIHIIPCLCLLIKCVQNHRITFPRKSRSHRFCLKAEPEKESSSGTPFSKAAQPLPYSLGCGEHFHHPRDYSKWQTSQDGDFSSLSLDSISLCNLSNHWLGAGLRVLVRGHSLEPRDHELQVLLPRIIYILYIKLFILNCLWNEIYQPSLGLEHNHLSSLI